MEPGRFAVDGKDLGTHPYPYARLELKTGPLAAGEHTVFAALDNRFDWKTQKLMRPYYDFYAYGGFYHGVRLETDEPRIFVRTRDYRTGEVEVEIEGGARKIVKVPDFKLWSPESPNMTTLEVEGRTVRFGIREIKAEKGKLWLNGKPLYLKGVNRHESHPTSGATTPGTLMLADIQNLKALGGNFIRGAHYQQCERFLDLCDEHGVLVWEESLGWGNGQGYTDGPSATRPAKEDPLTDAEFIRQQVIQTREMVRASFNHPSVIIYAFMNELGSYRPEARTLVEQLCKAVREEDSGRLTSFACNRPKDEVCGDLVDVMSFNAYPGWISTVPPGDEAHMRQLVAEDEGRGINVITRILRAKYPDKPLLVSEIGCCGIYGQHDEAAAQWTEEFQAEYVGDAIDAVFANPELCGIALWQYADAKSYLREWNVRVKPLAENLAGLYDGFRRPKLAVRTVKERYEAR